MLFTEFRIRKSIVEIKTNIQPKLFKLHLLFNVSTPPIQTAHHESRAEIIFLSYAARIGENIKKNVRN